MKILGITLDSALTFENHVNDVAKACNYHMRALRHLRRSLTRDVANTIGLKFVGYRIDYCNALLFSATDKVLDKIQCVQYNLARIVNNVSLRQLHQCDLNSLDLLRDLTRYGYEAESSTRSQCFATKAPCWWY